MAKTLHLFVCTEDLGDAAFRIIIEDSEAVIGLKEAISKTKPNDLKGIDADRLELYKIDIPDGEDLRQRAKAALKEELNVSSRKLSQIFPDPPQGERVSILVKASAQSVLQTEMVLTMANRTEFTMKLHGLERWDSLTVEDLNHSNIKEAESEFLQQFQERLGRKRYIAGGTQALFWESAQSYSTIPPRSLNSFLECDVSVPAETNISELDRVTISELAHYSSVLCGSQLRNRENYDQDKESQVRALLLEFLAVQQSVPDVTCTFGLVFPFHLIVDTDDGKRMMYTPRKDFCVSIKDFPHIVLEVNSQHNGGDEFRMLLQAACISRIGNWLRASISDPPIVIMAIYIDERFKAHQHILCQPNVGSIEVEYVSKVFDLTVPRTAFEFIFQMYNFFSVAKADNARLHRPGARLREVRLSVSRKDYPTLSGTKRKYEENQKKLVKKFKRNPDTSAQGGQEDSFGNQSVQRDVTRAGYTPTQPISEELTLLTPLKPTIRQATSRSGVLVVLKVIVDSNERQLLEYFSGIKASSNHTIPLLDGIDLSIEETIIVLPWKSPLDEVLQFRDRPDDVVSLCLQFIEGVAFLHQHNVAHCDLKPGNVVVDTKSESEVSLRLFIIDFDLALAVESEETMTEGWCGTPPWIAPELGSRNGPTRRYSPILADRWACGKMIQYFANYFPSYEGVHKTSLRAFAQRLLDFNPRARPELNQLQAIHSPQKRKAAKSLHESVPKRYAVNRHELEDDLLSLGSSFESPEAQVHQSIPAPDKAAEMCYFPMTGEVVG